MANNLGIEERTLAQISEATNTINVTGGAGIRKSVYQPLLCRITDHDDDGVGTEEDDPDLMAIFCSTRHGEPWVKDANNLEHIVVEADADPVANATPTNVTVLFPNYDYSTFE